MKYYMAPMEGITRYIYRNAYHKHFRAMDKYFTPFLSPSQNKTFKTREMQDVLPENNTDMFIVPQILSNKAEDFIEMAKRLGQLGYQEVNLNLGCPSPTVVTKGKGSGFLEHTEALDAFLEAVLDGVDMKISIKTRIGKDDPEEFHELMRIYNRYPLEELIIHPRIQQDHYKNTPNLEMFGMGLGISRSPVCYNGDICTASDCERILEQFSGIAAVMIGRGILQNPGLLESIADNTVLSKSKLRAFHDMIYEEYQEILFGEHVVLFKMKELWFHMLPIFADAERYGKIIKKVQNLKDYEQIIDSLFVEKEFAKERL